MRIRPLPPLRRPACCWWNSPSDLRAAHRVIDFQNVASLYQTGVRTERNPDYDAAQASLKEAQRESKRRGLSVLQVGDPMLDLIGMLVGRRDRDLRPVRQR